ncbi:MAG: hypothetical protein QF479_05185, partial [Candidatus Poseidoniaceae archaeon]|nr:hypothetical protein [Candidatus Poseidoniaceae archaeon]
MEPSVSHGKTVKSAFLVIIMIIMTQVGYLDLINSPKTGNDSFDDDSSSMETGGSGSSGGNGSVWQVADIHSSGGSLVRTAGVVGMEILVGDTIYFKADDGSSGRELWAHDTSNHSTWQVADINSGGNSDPGLSMQILVGDTLYFSADDGSTGPELWAHDTSNHSTWQVA